MTTAIRLTWPNKGLSLRADGVSGYTWVRECDRGSLAPTKAVQLTGGALNAMSNILAIGDGLDVLEALAAQTTVLDDGIRLVYIDPPFNTRVNRRHYEDSMPPAMWLSMMHERLSALQPLLARDASVWVHLDNKQAHHVREIMDEVFGENAFVASIAWQKKTTRDSRAAFSSNHDTIMVYAPSGPKKWKASRNLLAQHATHLRNRDDDPRGAWADAPFTAPGFRKGQQYVIITPTGRLLRPPRGRSWYATEPTYFDLLADGRIWFPKGGNGSPRLKLFAHQLRGLVPFTVWGTHDTGTNDDAKRHLLSMFPGADVFDTPKPEELLERIVHIASNPGELVVDIFGGSGTTAAVAHKMHRRWVVAERDPRVIMNFLLPRMLQVVNGDDQGGITEAVGWKGGGSFSVLNVAPRTGLLPLDYQPAAMKRAIAKLRCNSSVRRQTRTALSAA